LSRLAEIREAVLSDPELVAELAAIATEAELFTRVIALARERGLETTEAELAEAVRANRAAWLQRWIPQ
jgi:hypothetical protein